MVFVAVRPVGGAAQFRPTSPGVYQWTAEYSGDYAWYPSRSPCVDTGAQWTVRAAPPDTSIVAGPSGETSDDTPTFEFASDQVGSSFECRMDSASYGPCVTPYTAPELALGPHLFEVRARNQAQMVDPSPAARAFTVITHFSVELKAWIPHPSIVDPENPIVLPYFAYRRCAALPFAQSLVALTASRAAGDNHASYDGSARVRSALEFDFDGQKITNSQAIGALGRSWLMIVHVNPAAASTLAACSVPRQQTCCVSAASTSPQGFFVNYAAKYPFTPPVVTPAIDGRIDVVVAPADGSLRIQYSVNWFPSHGVQVIRDGKTLATAIVNDASCIPQSSVEGAVGFATVFDGLNSTRRTGELTVPPDPVSVSPRRSPLCA
jgi:hypothetical protein